MNLQIELTPQEAIVLHFFLISRSLMQSRDMPQIAKDSLVEASCSNLLLDVAQRKLANELQKLELE